MKKRKEKKREKNKKKCMQLHHVQGICALLLAAKSKFLTDWVSSYAVVVCGKQDPGNHFLPNRNSKMLMLKYNSALVALVYIYSFQEKKKKNL